MADALETLSMMFSEWDKETLGLVLASNNGDVEASVDVVLAFGTPEHYREQHEAHRQSEQQLSQSPPSTHVSADPTVVTPAPPPAASQAAVSSSVPVAAPGAEQPPPQMVMVTAPPGSRPGSVLSINHKGRSFLVKIPDGVQPGSQFIVSVPDAPSASAEPPRASDGGRGAASGPEGRGARVNLPPDFLRPPGWTRRQAEANGGGLGGMMGEMTDEQLALLLQDESFLQELASHPEFQQLHLEQQRALDEISQMNQQQAQAQRRTSTSLFSSSTSGAAAAGAATAESGATSSAAPNRPSGGSGTVRRGYTVSGMGDAMRARLKALGRKFTSRRSNRDSYGTLVSVDSDEFNPSDGSDMLPWGDDTEMVTFDSTSNIIHSEAGPADSSATASAAAVPSRGTAAPAFNAIPVSSAHAQASDDGPGVDAPLVEVEATEAKAPTAAEGEFAPMNTVKL